MRPKRLLPGLGSVDTCGDEKAKSQDQSSNGLVRGGSQYGGEIRQLPPPLKSPRAQITTTAEFKRRCHLGRGELDHRLTCRDGNGQQIAGGTQNVHEPRNVFQWSGSTSAEMRPVPQSRSHLLAQRPQTSLPVQRLSLRQVQFDRRATTSHGCSGTISDLHFTFTERIA